MNREVKALIASDSLPDLITIGYWEPQVKTIIDSQMVYSLNELAENYDIYFWKDTKEDVVKWYTMEDGNIYGYPCSATTLQDYEEKKETMTSNQTFVVRKDIYEALEVRICHAGRVFRSSRKSRGNVSGSKWGEADPGRCTCI